MIPRQLIPLCLLLGAACSSERGTAAKDLAAADSAIASIPAEAGDVVPDQIATLTESVKVGRQAFETGDYEAASTGLGGIPDQVKLLVDSLPARKAELTAVMDTLSIAFPRNLAAIQTELRKISRTGRRPQGLSREQEAEARKTAETAGAEWNEIKASFDGGKLAEAMGRAQNLKARVSQAMLAVGLVADERAWSNVTLPPKP